jgi:lysozyme
MGLSDTEIKYLLSNDISRVELELYNTFDWFDDLGEARGDAMVDICFNLGLPRLLKFKKALAAMDAKDYKLAAIEFLDSRWAEQVGQRAIELSLMIETGEY